MKKDYTIWVEAYLDGDLSTTEQKEFEALLQTDEALAKELSIQKDMIAVLDAKNKLALKDELSVMWNEVQQEQGLDFSKGNEEDSSSLKVVKDDLPANETTSEKTSKVVSMEGEENGKRSSRSLKSILAIAAMLLLAVSVFLLRPSNPNATQMARTYLEQPYKGPSIKMSAPDATINAKWEAAKTAYTQGNYEAAISNLSPIVASNNATYTQHYYLGLSHLYAKQPNYNAAITSLQNVLKTDNDYHTLAKWFMALAHLQNKQTAKAKSLLEEVVKEDGDKVAEAKKMLEGME